MASIEAPCSESGERKFQQIIGSSAALESVPYALLAIPLRIAVATVFWDSGTTKLASWDTTLPLFRDEYRLPIVPPELAAEIHTAVRRR